MKAESDAPRADVSGGKAVRARQGRGAVYARWFANGLGHGALRRTTIIDRPPHEKDATSVPD